jgi:hypothetical protein
VTTVVLDRPAVRNAVVRDTAAALGDAFRENLGRPVEDGLAREFARGAAVLEEARRGAERFAGGEGRQGSF